MLSGDSKPAVAVHLLRATRDETVCACQASEASVPALWCLAPATVKPCPVGHMELRSCAFRVEEGTVGHFLNCPPGRDLLSVP